MKYEYDLCIIGGAGHVGLPLAIAFADKGQKTVIFDINEKSLDMISRGEIPFMEEGAEPVLKKVINNKLFTSTSPEVISKSRIIISVTGTPVDEHLNPKFTLLKKMIDEYIYYFRDGQILILRSTVFPGSSEKTQRLLKQRGKDVAVAFCPERIVEGKAMQELGQLPQIISGFDAKTIQEVKKLFLLLTNKIVEVKPIEAELAKLCTNTWRYIKFAVANQFFLLAMQNDVNFQNLYRAITQDYPRAQDLPKPGFAAGPCLFKDTMQLNAYSNNSFFLGHSAMLVNEGLPDSIIHKMKSAFTLCDKNAGILGMAFKGESDDPRESLSYKIKKILEIECTNVYCSDAYIKDERFVSTKELINLSDIIIIATPHKEYAKIDKRLLKDKIVVDIWDILKLERRFL